MKKTFYCVVLIMTCLFLGSCMKMVTSFIISAKEVKNYHVIETHNDTLNKRVILFGMMHIGKPVYYESVRRKIDSLHSEGYVFFCESVGFPSGTDSLTIDTMSRKLRKLLGFHLTDYLNTENKSKKPYNTKKYISQIAETMGIDKYFDDCIHADLTTPELIRQYESDKGEIVLTEYDWQTPLLEKYKQRKSGDKTEYDMYYAIRTLRDKHLFEMIAESEHEKIAVLYGWAHIWKVSAQLRDSLGYVVDINK